MSHPIHNPPWHFDIDASFTSSMGVPIVLRIFENQPHTPYPHFFYISQWNPMLPHHGSILTIPPQCH
jgi:hypothetical protein